MNYIDFLKEKSQIGGNHGFDPFAGVGSEVYVPVELNRKAIGIELKESYYNQMVKNLKEVKKKVEQLTIF